MNTLSTTTLSWLLTYTVHSTVLLLGARVLSRRPLSASARDVLWKTALVGAIITASAQVGLGIQPSGSLSLPGTAVAANANAAASLDAPPRVGRADTPSRRAPSAEPEAPASIQAASDATGSTTSASSGSSLAAGIVFAWLFIGVALVIVYGARRMILVGRLGDRRPVVDGQLHEILTALEPRAGAGRVTLTASATISSPVALGLSEICVPSAALTDLDEEQQRGLLAHELAHLVRRDPVWLDAASLIERVFFFQPLNRMARREMQLAAEYLCDDWAAAHMGTGVPLAKCLARVAEWIQASPLGVPVAGMAEQRSLLVERIARLVETGAPRNAVPRAMLAGGAVLLLATMVAAAPGVHTSVSAGVQADDQGRAPDGRGPSVASAPRGTGPSPSPSGSPPPSPSPSGNSWSLHSGSEPQRADSTVVAALIERLKDSDAGVRRAAASSLGNLRSPKAVLPLIAILNDRDREVRLAVVQALGELRDRRSIDPLLELLHDPSSDIRRSALDGLEAFEKEIPTGPVIRALEDRSKDVRHRAAELLGNIHDGAAVAPLMIAARDQSSEVRQAAIQALGEIRDATAAHTVEAALGDMSADVRHAALHALDDMKVPVSREALMTAMADVSPDVRQTAVGIVKDRPFPGAVAVLVKLIDDPNSDVRVEAVSALGEIRDPAAWAAIRQALNSKDSKVRARAAEVLGERP